MDFLLISYDFVTLFYYFAKYDIIDKKIPAEEVLMNILLTAINAKFIHSNPAVYSLKAAAGLSGAQVEIGEYTINQNTDHILQDIYRKQPDVVAFSCYIWNRRMVEELIRELPEVLPGVRLWAGGPEATWDAEGFLEVCPEMSGIMRGEGEETFCRLVTYYIEGEGSQYV